MCLFGLAAGAGLVLGTLGPFGTYASMTPLGRLIFWETVLLCAAAVHIPALWAGQWIGARLSLAPVVWFLVAVVLAALPTTLFVIAITAVIYGVSRRPDLLEMFGYVTAISLPMQGLSVLVLNRSTAKDGPGAMPPADEERFSRINSTLLERLPPKVRGKVLCLEMQDHYVRVHTDRGSALVLMRMRDALAALGDQPGARVHRSWWVSSDSILRTCQSGRSWSLELTNGLVVPVSRERRAELVKLADPGVSPT